MCAKVLNHKMFSLLLMIFTIHLTGCKNHSNDGTTKSSEGPQLGDIARNADGSIRYMVRDVAIEYCASRGMRLPSAREMAQFWASRGAVGISETLKQGYYRINAKNVDGKNDPFFYNHDGYKRPEGDFGNYWFWSSSSDTHSLRGGFVFSGLDGTIGYTEYIYKAAVFCNSGI